MALYTLIVATTVLSLFLIFYLAIKIELLSLNTYLLRKLPVINTTFPGSIEVINKDSNIKAEIKNSSFILGLSDKFGVFSRKGVAFPYRGRIKFEKILILINNKEEFEIRHQFLVQDINFSEAEYHYDGTPKPIRIITYYPLEEEKTLVFDVLMDWQTISQNSWSESKLGLFLNTEILTIMAQAFYPQERDIDSITLWSRYKSLLEKQEHFPISVRL